MKDFHIQGVDYNISDTDLHNQNPVYGFIREVRRKWYRTMVNKRVPSQLWYYGLTWVS